MRFTSGVGRLIVNGGASAVSHPHSHRRDRWVTQEVSVQAKGAQHPRGQRAAWKLGRSLAQETLGGAVLEAGRQYKRKEGGKEV